MYKYLIMNKDNPIASFHFVPMEYGKHIIRNIECYSTLPYNCDKTNLGYWISSRFAAKHREHLANYLRSIGMQDVKGYIDLTYGVSIIDTFWVKPADSKITWNDVSLFRNDFDEVVQHLAFDGTGLFGERMSTTSPEFGTNGNFDKCWVRENNDIYMIKRGTNVAYNSGLEPYCEVLASQIFSAMHAGIPYDLINFRGKISSKCKLFTNEDLQYIPFGLMCNKLQDIYAYLDYFEEVLGETTSFRKLLICDAITLNTDRHVGNFGFLCSTEDNSIVKPAPGFDYNLSMMPYVTNDEFANIDNVVNKFTPCIGDNFITDAKVLMTSEIRDELLKLQGIELKLECDDKFPEKRLRYMTDIVNQRIDKILYDRSESYRPLKIEGLSNLYQYRLKFGFTDDDVWYQQEQPRLFQVFGCKHLNELEEEIKALL